MESKPLMFDAMLREHYERRLGLLLRALSGIASCATQCKCCAMHREIAERAVANDVSATGINGG
jgi:hypothetical protein